MYGTLTYILTLWRYGVKNCYIDYSFSLVNDGCVFYLISLLFLFNALKSPKFWSIWLHIFNGVVWMLTFSWRWRKVWQRWVSKHFIFAVRRCSTDLRTRRFSQICILRSFSLLDVLIFYDIRIYMHRRNKNLENGHKG